jgi:hypothetical protein
MGPTRAVGFVAEGELCRPGFVAECIFWRQNATSPDLRCVLWQDRVGAIELALHASWRKVMTRRKGSEPPRTPKG